MAGVVGVVVMAVAVAAFAAVWLHRVLWPQLRPSDRAPVAAYAATSERRPSGVKVGSEA